MRLSYLLALLPCQLFTASHTPTKRSDENLGTIDIGIATKQSMKKQDCVEATVEVGSEEAPADCNEEAAPSRLEATRRLNYDASEASVIGSRSPYVKYNVASPGHQGQYRQASKRTFVDRVNQREKALRQQQLILLQAEAEMLQGLSIEARSSGVTQKWVQDGHRGTGERNRAEEIQERDILDEYAGRVSSTEDSAIRHQSDSFIHPPFTISPGENRELPCKATADPAEDEGDLNKGGIEGASISLQPVGLSGHYRGLRLSVPQFLETYADLSKREPKKTKPTPEKDRSKWRAVSQGERTIRKMTSNVWSEQTKSIHEQMSVPIHKVPAATAQREDIIPSIHGLETQLQASSKGIRRQKIQFNSGDGEKRLELPSRETQTVAVHSHFPSMGTQTDPTRFSSIGTQTDPILSHPVGAKTEQLLHEGLHKQLRLQTPFRDTQAPSNPTPALEDSVPIKNDVASQSLAKQSSKHSGLQIDPSLKGPRLGEYLDVTIQLQTSMNDRKASGTPKSIAKDLAINAPKESVERYRAQTILPSHSSRKSLRLVGSAGLRAYPWWRRLRKKAPIYPPTVGLSGLQQTKYPFVTNHQASNEHVVDTAGNIENELSYPQIRPRRKRKTAGSAQVENQGKHCKRRVDSHFAIELSKSPLSAKKEPETLNGKTNDLNQDLSEQRHNTEYGSDDVFIVELDEHKSNELDDGTLSTYWFPGLNDRRADGQRKALRLKYHLKVRSIPMSKSVAIQTYQKKVAGIGVKPPSAYRHSGIKTKPKPTVAQKYRKFNQKSRHVIHDQKGAILPSSPNGVPPPNSTTDQPTKHPHEHPLRKTPILTPETTNGAVPDDSDEGSDWDEEYPT